MLLKSPLDATSVAAIVTGVSVARYAGNITCETRDDGKTRDGRRKVRFTLAVVSSFEHGARRSAWGRRLPKASWQAHRDVMRALFDTAPDAVLQTALTTYRNRDDFLDRFEATGDHNIGSRMHPVRIRDAATR